MKNLALAILMITVLFTSFVAAQDVGQSADPPDVTVLEKSWRKEVSTTPSASDTLKPNEDLIRETRAQKIFIRQRDNALPNQPTEPRMPTAGPRPIPPPTTTYPHYVYKMKVRNSGAKTIKALDWEYQFLNPDTREVMEQRTFSSKLRLSPGKTQVVKHRLTRQPTGVVDASKLDRKYQDQFTERVVIKRIVYSDGSVWQRQ